jgi:hypothetical protein
LSTGIGILGLLLSGGGSTFATVRQQNQSQNQNLTAYENTEYGFAFDYPANWQNESMLNVLDEIDMYVASVGDPLHEEGRVRTVFHVNVSDEPMSFNTTSMQLEADTIQDSAQRHIEFLEMVLEMSNGQASLDEGSLKNTTLSLSGGETAYRIQYVLDWKGEQHEVDFLVFAIKDDKVYTLTFITDPLKTPKTIPISEQIIQSFRFI